MFIEAKYHSYSVWDLDEMHDGGVIDFKPSDVEDWWIKWDILHIKLKGSDKIVELDSMDHEFKRPDEIWVDAERTYDKGCWSARPNTMPTACTETAA